MIITTWQETSDSLNVSVVSEEHWASLGQFHVRLGTSAFVYLTLKEIINLKRKISNAEREYFDNYYEEETA